MKNIEWLKEQMNHMHRKRDPDRDPDEWFISETALLKAIDKLDEQEVLSPEWISENVEYAYFDMLDGSGRLSSATAIIKPKKLQNILVPNQEEVDRAYKDGYDKGKEHATKVVKPTIPKFVADYIEECKKFDESGRKSLYTAMDSMPKKMSEWMTFGDESFGKGQELFARAWLDGYEVKVEQKYRVIDSHKVYLLAKEEDHNEVETVAKLVEIYGYNHAELDYNLTEQEIKDYDARYWAFRKPVEELE